MPELRQPLRLVREELPRLRRCGVAAFEPDYVVNPLSVHGVKALGAVISVAEGMKADMIVRQPDSWGESAFARRVQVQDPAFGRVWVSSPEDLIIAKLELSERGRSFKQMDDCRVIVRTRPDLDWEYLERLHRLSDSAAYSPPYVGRARPSWTPRSRPCRRRSGWRASGACRRSLSCAPGPWSNAPA